MNVALIPARGGSKSIPHKNIKIINGRPLIYWTIKAACDCEKIDSVYLSTDSDKIASIAADMRAEDDAINKKLEVIPRSEESATDTASTESVMLEFAADYEFDNIVLVQATSPLLSSKDLLDGFSVFEQDETDSVISVVLQKRFLWNVDSDLNAEAINYDVYNRPRRQDFDGYYMENGAFYITSKDLLLKSGNRVSGRIKACVIPDYTAIELDEKTDWVVVESLMRSLKGERCGRSNLDWNKIKVVLTDCDGCLTDGGMYYSEKGDELKKFNTKDGKAFELLRNLNIQTGIITSESVELNRRRARKIKADFFFDGCTSKKEAIEEICAQSGCTWEEVLYVGDDINDTEVIKSVGIGVCPADAVENIREIADLVLERRGGEGVIREVYDILIRERNRI